MKTQTVSVSQSLRKLNATQSVPDTSWWLCSKVLYDLITRQGEGIMRWQSNEGAIHAHINLIVVFPHLWRNSTYHRSFQGSNWRQTIRRHDNFKRMCLISVCYYCNYLEMLLSKCIRIELLKVSAWWSWLLLSFFLCNWSKTHDQGWTLLKNVFLLYLYPHRFMNDNLRPAEYSCTFIKSMRAEFFVTERQNQVTSLTPWL